MGPYLSVVQMKPKRCGSDAASNRGVCCGIGIRERREGQHAQTADGTGTESSDTIARTFVPRATRLLENPSPVASSYHQQPELHAHPSKDEVYPPLSCVGDRRFVGGRGRTWPCPRSKVERMTGPRTYLPPPVPADIHIAFQLVRRSYLASPEKSSGDELEIMLSTHTPPTWAPMQKFVRLLPSTLTSTFVRATRRITRGSLRPLGGWPMTVDRREP